MASRIIVALDFNDLADANKFLEHVSPDQCRLKIGLELFTRAGPSFVEQCIKRGFDVFLDLKFHDIPTTAARACAQAAKLGVWMLNVHALGGKAMLEAAREAIDRSSHRPLLLGVTLLTSHGDADLADMGFEVGVQNTVERLATMAHNAGLNGVVCSPREAIGLRKRFGQDFLLVTPGIRPEGNATDDQKRTCTPAEAIVNGSDFLVIGRPITRASNPVETLKTIQNQLPSL